LIQDYFTAKRISLKDEQNYYLKYVDMGIFSPYSLLMALCFNSSWSRSNDSRNFRKCTNNTSGI